MTKTSILAAGTAIGLFAAATGASAQTTATTGSQQTQAPAPGSQTTGTPAATSPGNPNATATLSQGATVYDTQGGTVGTIESIQGDFAVLATAKNKVRLPKSSFGTGAKGPVIAMTATQLDQAASQAAPQAAATPTKADVTKGAAVADTQGGAVGTVSDVDAQFATVELTTGGKVRLPVTAFGAGSNGGLRVAMTAAQLSAAASASGGSAAKSGSSS